MKSRVGDKAAPETRSPPSTPMPAFAIGMFQTRLSLNVTGVVNVPLLGFQQSGALALDKSGTMQWIDPIIGLRLRHRIGPGDEFQLRGDIGGFGVGSKFSWQLAGGYSHDMKIGDWTITNTVGYRALSVDYSNGTGSGQKGMDAIIHGPVMETSFRF